MGIFDAADDKALQAKVSELTEQLNDNAETIADLTQDRDESKLALAAITKAADKAGAAALAADIGLDIANLRWGTYESWDQYVRRVRDGVYRAIRKATTGAEPETVPEKY